MTDKDPVKSSSSEYAHGYSDLVVSEMSSRSVATNAGFFLPHFSPGMDLIDLGCGPGTITIGLADAVSPAKVLGIDFEPSMVEIASRNAEVAGVSNIEFIQADVTRLDVPTESFDAAFMHTILEHLDDPVAVLKSVNNILKPGSVVGLRHGDHGINLIHPEEPVLTEFSNRMSDSRHQTDADTAAGRKQQGWLRAAGFTNLRSTIYASPERGLGMVKILDKFLKEDRSKLVEHGAMTPEEIQDEELIRRWSDAVSRWLTDPDASYVQSVYWETIGFKHV